jgi:hypothetical protein
MGWPSGLATGLSQLLLGDIVFECIPWVRRLIVDYQTLPSKVLISYVFTHQCELGCV